VQTGTVSLDGTFTHNTGALITGTGTIDLPASYTFNGDINPGTVGGVGTLSFIGDLVLSGTTNITFDATSLAVRDQIVTSGTVTLAGNATVTGIIPNTSDLMTVITGSSPPINVGSWSVTGWTPQANGNTVEIVAN